MNELLNYVMLHECDFNAIVMLLMNAMFLNVSSLEIKKHVSEKYKCTTHVTVI